MDRERTMSGFGHPKGLTRRHTSSSTRAPSAPMGGETKLQQQNRTQVTCITCGAVAQVLCYNCNSGGEASAYCVECNGRVHRGDATREGWGPYDHFRTRVSCREGELFPDEDRRTEYKSVAKHSRGPADLVKLKCEKLMNGFLNAQGGSIFFGVDEKKVARLASGVDEKKSSSSSSSSSNNFTFLHPVEHVIYDRTTREDIRMIVERKVNMFYPAVSSELYQVVFTPLVCSGEHCDDPKTCEAHLLSIHVKRGKHALYAVRKPLYFAEICQAYERKDSSTYQMTTQSVMARLGSRAVPGPLCNGFASDIAKLKTMPDGSIRHRGWLVKILNDFVRGNDEQAQVETKAERRAHNHRLQHPSSHHPREKKRTKPSNGGRVLIMIGDPGQGKTLFCSNCILNCRSWAKWRYRAEYSNDERDFVRYYQSMRGAEETAEKAKRAQEYKEKRKEQRRVRREEERELAKRKEQKQEEEEEEEDHARKHRLPAPALEPTDTHIDTSVSTDLSKSRYENNVNPDVDCEEFRVNEETHPDFEVLGYHFIVANDSRTSDPGVFVRSLASLIVTSSLKHGSTALSGEAVEEALSEDRAMRDPESSLERGILAPLRNVNPGGRTRYVIFVDGLNEASDTGEGLSIVELLHRARTADKIPWWLTFVCTSTADDRVQRWAGSFTVLKLDPQSEETQDDLRAYIQARLDDENALKQSDHKKETICDVVLERSAGNFLYATLMLDAIRDGRLSTDATALEATPQTVNSLYFGMFKSLFRAHAASGVDYVTNIRPVFEVILASYTPLTEVDIEHSTKCSAHMGVIRHYLHEQLRDQRERQVATWHQTNVSSHGRQQRSSSQQQQQQRRRRMSSNGTPPRARSRTSIESSQGVFYKLSHKYRERSSSSGEIAVVPSPTADSKQAVVKHSVPPRQLEDSVGIAEDESLRARGAHSPTPSVNLNDDEDADVVEAEWAVEYSLFHQSLATWLVSEGAGEFRCCVRRGHLILAASALRGEFGSVCRDEAPRGLFEQRLEKWGYDWYLPVDMNAGYSCHLDKKDEVAARTGPFHVATLACHLADCQHGSMYLRAALLKGAFHGLQDARDSQNKNALFVVCAMQVENTTAVELLLQAGLDPNTRTTDGLTPLSIAARRGFLACAQVLLADVRTEVDCVSLKLHTPLHIAVRKGHMGVTRQLIAARADVNAMTKYGHTPLHIAVETGHARVVSLLLGAKADFGKTNRNGESALWSAAKNGDRSVLLELLQQNEKLVTAALRKSARHGLTPLGVAVSEYRGPTLEDEQKDVEVFRMLLAHGANTAAKDYCNRRIFFLACSAGKAAVVERLVERALAPLTVDNKSLPPPTGAEKRKHKHKKKNETDSEVDKLVNEAAYDLWKALKKSKHNPNTYKTPLFAATVNQQTAVVRTLVELSCKHGFFLDVNAAETRVHRTALMDSCFAQGRHDITAALLEHPDINVDLAEDDGGTALMDACYTGNLECTALLLERKADVRIVDRGGVAAVHFAVGRGHVEVATRMFVALGGKDVWCKKNFSTLHVLGEVAAKVARCETVREEMFAAYQRCFCADSKVVLKHARTTSNPKLKHLLKELCVDSMIRTLGAEHYLQNLLDVHAVVQEHAYLRESYLACTQGGDAQVFAGHFALRAPSPRFLPQWLVEQQQREQQKQTVPSKNETKKDKKKKQRH